jgi:uncharacterized protein YukE
VASALQGGAAAFNSLTTGAAAATASISSALSGVGTGLSLPSTSAITGALTGAAARAGSLASTAVNTLSGLVKGTPIAGINVADFANQGPALGSISNMSLSDVTGTLAQASKLVGQGASTISNALGAGKFGFDASQLERAGLVKPGTAASFLALGENDLVSVLKSPTVWTGKDGVKSLEGLLSNTGLQDKVQQGLMKTGLGDLKSIGIPTDKLTPQALSGLATNAAKSVSNTVDWVKNTPGLPADVKAKFDAVATNGAFAVNLAQTKVDAPVLQETKPLAAEDTVNSATVDAAATRIVGNDKVPSVSSGTGSAAEIAVFAYLDLLGDIAAGFESVSQSISALDQQSQITQEEWNTINQEYQAVRATFNARVEGLAQAVIDSIKTLSPSDPKYDRILYVYNRLPEIAKRLKERSAIIKKLLADLANKIVI